MYCMGIVPRCTGILRGNSDDGDNNDDADDDWVADDALTLHHFPEI